jgi:hypothetical protein
MSQQQQQQQARAELPSADDRGSFYNSFFQNQDDNNYNGYDLGEEHADEKPHATSRGVPAAAAAAAAGGGAAGAVDLLSQNAAAAAAAMASMTTTTTDANEPVRSDTFSTTTDVKEGPTTGSTKSDRLPSWYTEALLQGGASDELNAMLAQVQNVEVAAARGEHYTDEEDDVLEQYRIMAHVEANIRVKENTGFDLTEYENRRKLLDHNGKEERVMSRKPKPYLPEPSKVLPANSSSSSRRGALKPEEPPIPPPRVNRGFMEQRTPRVPELSPGSLVRGSAIHDGVLSEGEHVVRCLACRSQLRVNMLSSLVSCPECNTVSPASSTRR